MFTFFLLNDNIFQKVKSDIESMSKKIKVMDSALQDAEKALQNYQLLKQQKLNELDVVVHHLERA